MDRMKCQNTIQSISHKSEIHLGIQNSCGTNSLNGPFVICNYEFHTFFHHSFLQSSLNTLRMTFRGLLQYL